MNANELADELDGLDWDRNPLALQNIKKLSATMLRQQQAEIDRLKKEWDYWYTLAIERGKVQEK